MDLCGQKIVDVSMDGRKTKKLVINALKDAINYSSNIKGRIFHFDRGSQYCANDYNKGGEGSRDSS